METGSSFPLSTSSEILCQSRSRICWCWKAQSIEAVNNPGNPAQTRIAQLVGRQADFSILQAETVEPMGTGQAFALRPGNQPPQFPAAVVIAQDGKEGVDRGVHRTWVESRRLRVRESIPRAENAPPAGRCPSCMGGRVSCGPSGRIEKGCRRLVLCKAANPETIPALRNSSIACSGSSGRSGEYLL